MLTMAMFQCDYAAQTVPFTLVCNVLPDCLDGSDETFCRHSKCQHFEHPCDNGQCLGVGFRKNIRCDRVIDCYDESDESVCVLASTSGFTTVTVNPPARLDHTPEYFLTVTPLETQLTCPKSHFSCLRDFDYCLPVYVRCNNYYDCPNHEDEAGCENYTCPGLYRCRGSVVCLHVTHLCDGVVQCQDQDDEVLCDFSCPQTCHCQGLAFLCPQPFPAASFPRLRYLDATHSSITFHLLQRNSYLIWLSLRDCRLRAVSNNTFVNLRFLDLSQNMIQTIGVVFLETLENLREIRLSENPLAAITPGKVTGHHTGLQKLDLSVTRIAEFNCSVFSSFPDVVFLNISHCDGLKISGIGLKCFPFLREIDVRGSHIQQSALSIFEGLQIIELILSDNYRHCCSSILHKVSRDVFCLAPSTGYSSCSHLLRFNLHRIFICTLVIFSFLGSVCSMLQQCLQGEKDFFDRSIQVFILSLIVADFLMGICLSFIVSGDVRFHGNFAWHEKDWTLSISCQTAHFMAFVSTEASCFTCLCLIIDRLTALRFPWGRLHWRSACMACVVVWLTALCLAIVPVLPAASGWKAGRLTNLCIPMAVIGDQSDGHAYAWGVLVGLNSITALVAASCLSLVYHDVRSHYVMATCSQSSQDLVMARRVMPIVLTDVIYWLGIGLCGIISCSTPSAEISDIMTTAFVAGVPLKPVINPLLYLNGLLVERRRTVAEARLQLLLERRLRLPPVRGPSTAIQAPLSVPHETRTLSAQTACLSPQPLSAHTQLDRCAQAQVAETLSAVQSRKTKPHVEAPRTKQPQQS